jgi:hypothetical protein
VKIYVNSRFYSKRANLLIISILLSFCTISVLLYVKYDKFGYEYGLDCTFCENNLPYGITPYSDRYRSFTLLDNDKFNLVGSGFRYSKSSFTINNFLSYAYNDTSIIVKCTDSLSNVKYLSSYVTEYKNKAGSPVISFRDLDKVHFQEISNNYQWYNVDKETIDSKTSKKYIMLLLCVLSGILFFTSSVILLIKKKRSKKI